MRLCGAHDWNRTNDLLLTKEVLYRLSYVSDAKFSDLRQRLNGAGDGNRTRTSSLEGYSSTIELLPPGGTSCRKTDSRGASFRPWSRWWREVDSNHRRHEPADLQSAPVGRLGIPPGTLKFSKLVSILAGGDLNLRRREKTPGRSACRFMHSITRPRAAAYCRFQRTFLSRRHRKC